MALTYEEFEQFVPEETKKFFYKSLNDINFYETVERGIKFRSLDSSTTCIESTSFMSFLYELSLLDGEYATFMGSCGFDRDLYPEDFSPNFPNTKNSYKMLYDKYNFLLPQYDDETIYYSLSPFDIVRNSYDKYKSRCSSEILDGLILVTLANFNSMLQKATNEKNKEIEAATENSIYSGIPISVITYIETASKIRTILLKKLNQNNEMVKATDKDIIPLSLLYALFYCADNNKGKKSNQNLTEYEEIVYYLQSMGVTREKILQTLGLTIDYDEINGVSRNIYAIKKEYIRYCNNDNNSISNLNVLSIVEKLFSRSFTKSLFIEKLLTKMNCHIDSFNNIREDIKTTSENLRIKKEQDDLQKFNYNLSKELVTFMEFVCKTYQVITKKMTENKHNSVALSSNEDAVCLSLFIASYYFNSDISIFFKENGASLDKVLRFLKIDLNKSEIEKETVSSTDLIKNYSSYIHNGVNSNMSSENITINDVCMNMCNREFTKSTIMECIFNNFSSYNLLGNFKDQLNNFLEERENKRQAELSQKFFHDMPAEVVKVIELAAFIYEKISSYTSNGYSKKDLQSIAMLMAVIDNPYDEITKSIFNKKGITFKNLANRFQIFKYSYSDLWKQSGDIDLIIKDFGEIIFGGYNKNRERNKFTIFDLSRNIFSRDFNNSVAISKLLNNYNLDYDAFNDLEDAYQQEKMEIERKEELEKSKLYLINNFITYFLEYLCFVFEIYEKLAKEVKSGKFNKDIIKGDEDLITLSFLLSTLKGDYNRSYFLKKNHFTINEILSTCGIDSKILNCKIMGSKDFTHANKEFNEIINYFINNDISETKDCLKPLFQIDKYRHIIERIAEKTNTNVNTLAREIQSGKNYEDSLTFEERKQLLSNSKIDELDPTSMESILNFGSSLTSHSKFIHNELPSLISNDTNEIAIHKINDIINKIYVPKSKQVKQPSFFERLFGSSIEEKEKNQEFNIDEDELKSLSHAINECLSRLKSELLKYDDIRSYIQEYLKKNHSFSKLLNQAIDEMNIYIDKMDSDDEEQFPDYLTFNSMLQIINDKRNRFTITDLLMRKELLRVNQAVVNHFITINSLEMARDDLIPLIKSEIAIGQGMDTENQSLQLSKNVMGLFQSILTRNVDKAIENMHELESTSVSKELLTVISNDLNNYIRGINQSKMLEEKLANSSDINEKDLSLNEAPLQKCIGDKKN